MYRAVNKVVPLPDHRLLLSFEGGERRIFDVTPYLGRGVFAALQQESVFESVCVSFDTVMWPNGADLCPELLYAESRPVAQDFPGQP
ncbi:MAG: DUF2442 domain-containing protein [Pirellulales bacterium]